ncbi:MAG TPA: amidase [Candidatus Binataceae bacterium]|jgi:aspartyl-tRNA(Asn)/glutamyl-tRNA(Gln) amidotransferase subunit A|nr:amidase [Candidatus Binataceae bacterium]
MDEFLTIAAASRLIGARKLSAVELTQHYLARIRRLDPILHSFIVVTEERALSDARAAQARVMAGAARGPLDGIPIAHKDIYCTAGIATTAHSRHLQDHIPERDATVVRKLAQAGTVLLGKLATHEFAFGGPAFDLPWPPARNPWNTAHFTGGSSSGTGAAVAAGLIMGGTGSDTGGSIRSPAALCGITGIKPTYGLCSRAGVLPLAFSMDHIGPLAWTAEDCALLLHKMAEPDAVDPASSGRIAPDYMATLNDGVKGLRIGVVRHFHESDNPVSDGTRKGIEGAIEVFRALGAEMRELRLPPLADYSACGWLILLCEAFATHERWMQTGFAQYGAMLRDRMALGGLISGADYLQAVRKRRSLCAATAAAMEPVDMLLTAAQPAEALPIDAVPKWGILEQPSFTIPFNVTGQPAMAVRAGFGALGLPVSIQLAGKPFAEATLLSAAHAFEQATQWRNQRPPMARIGAGAPGDLSSTTR